MGSVPLETGTADACAQSDDCLHMVETHLLALRVEQAQRDLGWSALVGSAGGAPGERAASSPPMRSARWLNAAGLLALLVGQPQVAVQHLEAALTLPLSPVSLTAAKNLYWASHFDVVDGDTAELQYGLIHFRAQQVLEIFQRTSVAMGDPSTAPRAFHGSRVHAGVSIFELPVQAAVCSHPLYDQNRDRARHYWSALDKPTRWRRRYLDLLKRSLTRYLTRDLTEDLQALKGNDAEAVKQKCADEAEKNGDALAACEAPWHIGQGAGQPEGPFSQKHLSGLVHLEALLEDVITRRVPGDVLEAGCYTGGTAVLLKAVLDADDDDGAAESGDVQGEDVDVDEDEDEEDDDDAQERSAGPPRTRRLFLADSFEGIPMPRTERARSIDTTATWKDSYRYVTGLSQARSTLRRYGVLDDRVAFIKGYFNETLPRVPSRAFALIHIDADAYDSVLDALEASYSRLVPGGHVVVDDWHLPGVRAAVQDFRRRHQVKEPILPVPSDHVTTCAPDWFTPSALTVHPLTVAWWTRNE